MNWKGIFGFIKAGYYSSLNKQVDIEVLGKLGNVDEYIVVAPLLAGGLAPTARTFLKTIPIEKVHLIVTSDGSHLKNHSDYKSVSDIAKNNRDEDLIVDTLVNSLVNMQTK